MDDAAINLNCRPQYRVVEDGNIVDADKLRVGVVNEGDLFVALEEPVHVEYRRYGTVGNGLVGYVLMERLIFVKMICD